MRIVVVSDSHNSFSALHRVVEAQPQAGVFLHLGDGESEFDDLRALYPDKRMAQVKGNCDWGSPSKEEDMLICEGKRIFFTHGHLYDVKRGLDRLTRRARKLLADIACFGHTHAAISHYVEGLYLLNPGSLALPRRTSPTYGVIDLTPAGIAINIVQL